MSGEISPSGSPIHRYEPRQTQWEAPDMSDSSMEAIGAHIEKHIGPVATVWHEILSDLVHIDVHQVAPTAERPYWTLITSGMSDKPMPAPPGCEEWRYAELMLCLPKEWKMDQTDFKDEANYWPIRWLKTLARFPHEYQAWLSWGHTMPNGDPPEPIHETIPFSGMLLLRPRSVRKEFWNLKIRENKTIRFFSVIPLYASEMDLKLRLGAEALETRLLAKNVTELVNPRRPDVTRREWWKWW